MIVFLFSGLADFHSQAIMLNHFTICRFRNALLEINLYESLFAEVSHQLEEKNLLVKESNGVIVDLTIIKS